MNFINCILQLYFLNEFLAPNYTFWGFGILHDIFNNRKWHQSGHFPRVRICNKKVKLFLGYLL